MNADPRQHQAPGILRRIAEFLRTQGRGLVELKDSPHAIAGGAAIGIFMGFPPLFGIKTLACLGLAWILRLNPIAAVIAVCLTDILTPVLPVLLTLQYGIGAWILGHWHDLPPSLDAHHLSLSDMLKWTTFVGVAFPMLVGSLVLAIPAAAITYPLVLRIATNHQNRRAKNPEPRT